MADIVDPATRSRIMARIRGKDTKPDLPVLDPRTLTESAVDHCRAIF